MSVVSSLLNHVLTHSLKGNVQSVLHTIDDYCWEKSAMMHVGDKKGKILDEQVKNRRPKTVLELGTFCGYSSLRIASHLPDDAFFLTFEINPETADIARQIHEHANVSDRIKIIVGSTETLIPKITEYFNISSFDFIFIDHWKNAYLRDLKLLEQANLIVSGTMIVADNVIYPGAPDYLNYIRNNPNYSTKLYESLLEYSNDVKDGLEVSIRK